MTTAPFYMRFSWEWIWRLGQGIFILLGGLWFVFGWYNDTLTTKKDVAAARQEAGEFRQLVRTELKEMRTAIHTIEQFVNKAESSGMKITKPPK